MTTPETFLDELADASAEELRMLVEEADKGLVLDTLVLAAQQGDRHDILGQLPSHIFRDLLLFLANDPEPRALPAVERALRSDEPGLSWPLWGDALNNAARRDCHEIAEMLLNYPPAQIDASTDTQTREMYARLHQAIILASDRGHAFMLDTLAAHPFAHEIMQQPDVQERVLNEAASRGQLDALRWWLAQGAPLTVESMVGAAQNGRDHALEVLLVHAKASEALPAAFKSAVDAVYIPAVDRLGIALGPAALNNRTVQSWLKGSSHDLPRLHVLWEQTLLAKTLPAAAPRTVSKLRI